MDVKHSAVLEMAPGQYAQRTFFKYLARAIGIPYFVQKQGMSGTEFVQVSTDAHLRELRKAVNVVAE